MTPRSLIFALALLIAVPAAAQNQCSLGMTMTCPNNTSCTAVTTNTGTNMCTGEYIVAILIDDPQDRGSVSGFQNGLEEVLIIVEGVHAPIPDAPTPN